MKKYKCRYLISSSCPIRDEYDDEFIRIREAWDRSRLYFNHVDTPSSRRYYILDIVVEESNEDDLIIETHGNLSAIYCILFSVYYGKVFYDHGLLESKGMHFVPQLEAPNNIYYSIAPYNSKVRPDACGSNSWKKLLGLKACLSNEFLNGFTKEITTFFIAAKHYWLSLNQVLREPEIAYINLVTSGEVLSSNFEFGDEELFDEQTQALLSEIENELVDGKKKARIIKKRLFQIKKRYVLTVKKLLDENFFEAKPYGGNRRITKDNLEKLVKRSYDLRSTYLHSGKAFGDLAICRPDIDDEYQNPFSQNSSKEMEKLMKETPRYMGMEKIVHYCLYKYLVEHILS